MEILQLATPHANKFIYTSRNSTSTFGVSTGKWYWENKLCFNNTSFNKSYRIGILLFNQLPTASQEFWNHEHDWGYLMDYAS